MTAPETCRGAGLASMPSVPRQRAVEAGAEFGGVGAVVVAQRAARAAKAAATTKRQRRFIVRMGKEYGSAAPEGIPRG